ncbi:hypothetical protein FB451DRAFT_1398556 [Mycena latifolia]|nr:hypothetical protein FB451DRAFT_1398556 [Mycena latifolia]
MPTIPVVAFVLGGWNLGIAADLLLQGVVFAQIAHYITLYKRDILPLRAFVWGLLFATTFKSAQIIAIMWVQNVQYFTNIDAAVGMFYDFWACQADLTLVALIALYVQLFFCQRLWAISKNAYLVAGIIALFIFALVAAVVSTVFTVGRNVPQIAPWLAAHLGAVFAGDLFLCAGTTFYLLRRSREALPQTAGMLDSILKLTFQSAAPAAFCALVNLICTQATPNGTTGWTMIAIIANQALPKLYAMSAMWTLNSRKNIRLARSHGQTTSSNDNTPSGRRRTNNVELGALSGHHAIVPIQVRTQVQTMQQTDSEMYSPKPHLDDVSEQDEQDSTRNMKH